jgi:hypothetical protein
MCKSWPHACETEIAFPSESTPFDLLAKDAVNRYLSNLEKDKIQTAVAMCDPEVSILDEFPPHAWHGPTACADWWKELLEYDEKSGITDGDAALGKPWTVDVNADRAYFVAPMTYTYKQNGKSVKETAAFAVALKRTQAGWRITSWTYDARFCGDVYTCKAQ